MRNSFLRICRFCGLLVIMGGSAKGQIVYVTSWGFDAEDSTAYLQAAINSGAQTVMVSNVGQDWVITPINLKSNQEIIFESGVVVTAKPGAFQGTHDSLFNATDTINTTITAYGAVFRMQKEHYMAGSGGGGIYPPAEWRSGFFLNGVSYFMFRGGTIRDTGGDGVYLGDWGKGYNDHVTIEDVTFDNNYRQGISVISAENLLIENCLLKNTSGHGPAAGIDLEPDYYLSRLVDIVIRDCIAENNQGPGFVVSPVGLTSSGPDISILFENCRVTSGQSHGFMVSGVKDSGAGGVIEFNNCHAQNTFLHGIRILDKSSTRARVRFVGCSLKDVARGPLDAGGYPGVPNLPIMIHLRGTSWSTQPGGVDFIDCVVQDDQDRPFLAYRAPFANSPALYDIKGNIGVFNPNGVQLDLGSQTVGVDLVVENITSALPQGDINQDSAVNSQDVSLMAQNWLSQGAWVHAGIVIPNFADGLEPPANGSFVPMTSSDFGQGYNNLQVRVMLWYATNSVYTHTDTTRSINYPEYGYVAKGIYGPIIADPTATVGSAFPAIHFIAAQAGHYSLDGTAILSGQKSRTYVQHVTANSASLIGTGWTTANDMVQTVTIDFGADPGLQQISMAAGEGLAIVVYCQDANGNTTSLDLGGDGSDPVRIIWEEADDWIPVSPLGDLNDDLTVNLLDLALLTQNWLIHCAQTPQDPACSGL